MKKRTLRFIGDIHGQYASYFALTRDVDYSFQVGDVGYSYDAPASFLDPFRHVAIAGNHECYDELSPNYFKKQAFFLNNYGLHQFDGFPPIFYVRGAWSIDQERRRKEEKKYGKKWWPTEELSFEDLADATELYASSKPSIVVTHECPLSIVKHVTRPEVTQMLGFAEGVIKTRTNVALEAMLAIHRPKLWIFGHYHASHVLKDGGTTFRCIDMIGGKSKPYWDLREGFVV